MADVHVTELPVTLVDAANVAVPVLTVDPVLQKCDPQVAPLE